MRRKQLYAIILAGALAASSAPAAVFAAEGDVAATAETSEENPVDGETAAATEAPAEETPADTTAATEAPAEQAPAQEAAAATEAPAQEAAPAEQTQQTTEETPAVQETPAAETSETTETEGETEELAPGETTEQTAISITLKATEEGQEDKVRYFDTLQHAIDAAPEYNAETNRGATVIEVSGQIELENTVTVKANKKVCIRATNAITISRKAGTLTADMFQVSGENAELQFDVKEDAENASLTVSGSLDEANTQVVDGSIVKVSEKGAFGIGTGVTLKDNNTRAEGGAITNKDGNVVLYGGTITGNTGVKGGGIYTNTSINVQGTVVVNENKRGTEVSNICLDGATTMINVTDVLTGSDISFAHLNEADALTVVKAGVNSAGTALTADNFKTVIDANDESNSQIKYENKDAYTLNLAADNLSAVLKKTEPVDPVKPGPAAFVIKETGSVSWSDYTTATAYFNTTNDCKWYYKLVKEDDNVSTDDFNESKAANSASAGDVPVYVKNIPTGNYAIAVYAKSQTDGTVQALKIVLNNRPATTFKISKASNTKDEWDDYNNVTVYFTASHDCKYYYQIIKSDAKSVSYSDSKAKYTAKAGDVIHVDVKDVPDGDGYAIVILARSTQDNAIKTCKITFSNRPAKSSTANRKAKTYSVTDNKVTGLENPLKFFPSKKYEFTVTEAGMSDEAPYVVGDERYAFLYWSTSSSGKNPQAKKVIMSSKGIPDANTYKMYLFFQKYRFNGTDWVKKGSPESISTEFSSAGYTDEELKEYLEEAKENGMEIPGYENGSGSGDDADAELTATAAASEKDAGSKSKSAVSTADESPIGTMSALAVLSLLAGGYIVVRKRKKEEQ